MRIIDGRQAKAARIVLGMTVDEMAIASGLHRNNVMRVEGMKGIRWTSFDQGGHSVRCLMKAIEERGVLCDVQEGQPIVRFTTTPARPKYVRKVAAAKADSRQDQQKAETNLFAGGVVLVTGVFAEGFAKVGDYEK